MEGRFNPLFNQLGLRRPWKVVSIRCSRSPGAGWHGLFYKGIAYKEGEGVTFWGGEKRADKMFTELF